ncbi:Gcd1p [Sugiyamaella lignohabitans]|uniref:Translation initiation factor eIF2B subunit gamma n=1 Tax=Sugiyamaella lignohabitans TaxID=796027 RepID=A0A167DYG7_9ASCO|nr:Gcd1p [Sugiyamaella lignohabitans]ANB13443.1 Gcd1p [Sugiyamaella lignohabitans]
MVQVWLLDQSYGKPNMTLEITVAVSSRHYDEVKCYVEKAHTTENIEVVAVEDIKHSGQILQQLSSKISNDFVVLPCDFITDIDPETLINVHRNNQGGGNALVSGIYYRNNLEAIDKKSLVADYIVHTPDNKSSDPVLLDVYNKEEISGKKALEVRMSMLWRFPYSVVSNKILRASIFFCSHKVLSLLTPDSEDNTRINAQNKNIDKVVRDIARRSWRHRQPLETVAMNIIPATNDLSEPTTFIRVNTISAYLEANRYMMRLQAKKLGPQHNQPAVKGQAAIGADSTLGERTTVSERTSIKRTIIGHDCKIGKKCRITGCVILDGVVIEDDVVLENCVIGKGCNIQSKARLVSCNVEGGYKVAQGFQAKNETLQNLTMESLLDGDSEGESIHGTDALVSSEDEDDDRSDGQSQWEVSEGDDVDSDDDGLFDRS